ncbi:hypothetical protein PO909_008806 [Leuciscus waleckii]
MGQERVVPAKLLFDLEVSSVDSSVFYKLPEVLTQKKMPVSSDSIVKRSLRVVFDCGATFKGTSLNQQLLQGPNLTSTLLGVLLRFRLEPVAVMGDIQAMFHQAKILLQELCRRNFGWDETVPQDIAQQWLRWLEDLDMLSEFKVDRCVKPKGFGQPRHAQLHHFADASETGYGAELRFQLQQSIFWTDSTSVLNYIKNEDKRFHTFVANRVSTIRGATETSQWRYISSKENPADEASRGVRVGDFIHGRRWIEGPGFLCKPESNWTTNMVETVIEPDDQEVKKELAIIRYCQQQRFGEEIAMLSAGNSTVSRRSTIYRLDPRLDDGLLRVGGRLTRSSLPESIKHPLILSKDQNVATLILRHIHQQQGHSGRNHTLSTLRKKYWVTSANSAVRRVITECVCCKKYDGKMQEQRMADLPKERILPDKPPFTNVGVDYFGPITVRK